MTQLRIFKRLAKLLFCRRAACNCTSALLLMVITISIVCFILFLPAKKSSTWPSTPSKNRQYPVNNTKKETGPILHNTAAPTSVGLGHFYRQARKRLIHLAENLEGALLGPSGLAPGSQKHPVALHCPGSPFLVIVVMSRASAFLQREAIRLSWGSNQINNHVNRLLLGTESSKTDINLSWKVIFVIGISEDEETAKLADNESATYNDILKVNYPESFRNLTSKSLAAFNWVSKNCNAKYILKTDDDCYVNVRGLLQWLNRLPSKYNYIGKVQSGMEVVRDKNDRYFVSSERFPNKFYPEYCSGGGYILKSDILPELLRTAQTVNLIANEDAFIGIVVKQLHYLVHFKHDQRFMPFIYTDNPDITTLHPCEIKSSFVIHGVREMAQLRLHFNCLLASINTFLCEGLGEDEDLLLLVPPPE
eukprot:gene6929-7707_t